MYLKPSPRLPMSSRRRALERRAPRSPSRGGRASPRCARASTMRLRVPSGRSSYVGTRNIDRPGEAARTDRSGSFAVLGARDDEVVLAVARGDEDLLPGDEPVAVGVLLAARRAARAMSLPASGSVMSMQPHASPRTISSIYAREARLDDRAASRGSNSVVPSRTREQQHRHRHAAVERVVRHDDDVGARRTARDARK